MSQVEVEELSDLIMIQVRHFLNFDESLMGQGIYGYFPIDQEVDLLRFYQECLDHGIPLAFPRIIEGFMDFYQVRSMGDDFHQGTYQIMEPNDTCSKVYWNDANCLVPGLVFDEKGNRYGYGAGYYDKYFAKHPGLYKIGVSYDHQIEKEPIFVEETDIQMNLIITDQRIIRGMKFSG
ncbi:MAG: 5-formyltetrahydrofolate cyclo-ligase [Lachnospiraceae bacterium]